LKVKVTSEKQNIVRKIAHKIFKCKATKSPKLLEAKLTWNSHRF
jgi:hypothetical protein